MMRDERKVKIIDVKESILEDNDKDADLLRQELKNEGIFYVNIMSSPGSGKTTTLLQLLPRLAKEAPCGVLEADIDSDVDALTIAGAGYPSVQVHTGGMCHLDADMSRQGLRELAAELWPAEEKKPAIVFLENVGNLVCPAEFDTGAQLDLVILSIPEGDDKPLKYPLVFQKADAVIVNKIDALEVFDFDLGEFRANVAERGPAPVFAVSAATGEGMDELASWLLAQYREWRNA